MVHIVLKLMNIRDIIAKQAMICVSFSYHNKIKVEKVEIGNNINQHEIEDINIDQIKQLIADYLEISQNIISIKAK